MAAHRQLRRAKADLERETGADDLEGFVLVAEGDRLLAMVGSVSGGSFNRTDSVTAYWPGSPLKLFYYAEHLA